MTPVIGSMFLLYLCGILSVRLRQALGRVRDLRYQLWLATLVLVVAVLSARGVVEELRTNGQLGSGPTDYYVAWLALVAGSALTPGLGWLVATYGFQVTPVRGWTFFYAADVVARWASSTRSAWDQINPRTLTDGWPLAEEAGIIVISLALLAALLRARRRIPLRVGAEPGLVRDRIRSEALSLPLLMGGGIYPAMMAAVWIVGVNLAIQWVHGPAIVDPAAAGLLFLIGLGSVAFLQRANFNPDDVASNLRRHSARIPGIQPGAATAAYIHRRVTLLTVIAAPWFALLLAAPQLVELLVPPEARIGLHGITIVLVGTIVIGILDTLGETAAE